MFKKIMTPVDLVHADTLQKTLQCAADLSGHYQAPVVYVAVTAPQPTKIAHTPQEFAQKLEAFAKEQGDKHGITTESHAITSHDPTIDLDDRLLKAVGETGSDLVVMATHPPNFTDYIWPSNGGYLAEHSKASVLLVR
ncbi:universal stress protein [Rhodosalinus sp.]|uniref:universal stress protein n=1 Tax=Rhodosalinus sp. TaxID=2047741 RepID=UPI003561B46B